MFTDEMTTAQRIAAAKATMTKVLDHFLYLLELHENTAIIVYSPHLSDQIPTSYAANAFNVFQSGMHRLEIIRLCALWDKAEREKECVPTVIKLIDNADVLNALADETRSHWVTLEGCILNSAEDPELAREAQKILRHSNAQFGDEQAALAQHELKESIRAAREIMSSPKLKTIHNLRNKHLAHSLSATRAEKAGPVGAIKYGDERDILDATCDIVEKLYCWVNGASFSIADSREIDGKNARALWGGCKFEVLR